MTDCDSCFLFFCSPPGGVEKDEVDPQPPRGGFINISKSISPPPLWGVPITIGIWVKSRGGTFSTEPTKEAKFKGMGQGRGKFDQIIRMFSWLVIFSQ
jgi:hypothetical protein